MMQRERSQTQRDTHGVMPRVHNVQGKFTDRKCIRSCRGGGGGKGDCLLGMGFSLGRWKVLDMDSGDSCTTV